MSMSILNEVEQVIDESRIPKTLVVVDIQPSYEDYVRYMLDDFIEHLNENEYNKIVYLFNGPDLGMEGFDEIYEWLLDNGLDEAVHIDQTFEKNYAFFRDVMDEGILDDDEMIELGKYMIENDVSDVRDMSEEDWDALSFDVDKKEELQLENHGFYIPDVADELKHLDNIVLVGGGETECLREVELLLDMLGKPYDRIENLIY